MLYQFGLQVLASFIGCFLVVGMLAIIEKRQDRKRNKRGY